MNQDLLTIGKIGNDSADRYWARSQIVDWSQFSDRRTCPDRTTCNTWLIIYFVEMSIEIQLILSPSAATVTAEEFLREYQHAYRLSAHKNILTVYDVAFQVSSRNLEPTLSPNSILFLCFTAQLCEPPSNTIQVANLYNFLLYRASL